MPVEAVGTVTVHGIFGDIQQAYDAAYDTQIPVLPVGSSHVEIHRGSAPWQRMWYSLTGAANTWRSMQPPSRYPMGPTRVNLDGETNVYLRKPYNPRHISTWPGVAPGKSGSYLGSWDATTNTPTLANGTGSDRQYYYVIAAGTVDFGAGNIVFVVGDWVIYDGAAGEWIKATEDPRKSLMDDRLIEVTVSFSLD